MVLIRLCRGSPYDGANSADEDEDVVMVVQPATSPDGRREARGSTLSPVEESVLAFERTQWRRASAKDDAIRARFGMSPAAYYSLLSRLIESDEALAFDPLLVQRLQRRVAERTSWSLEAVR